MRSLTFTLALSLAFLGHAWPLAAPASADVVAATEMLALHNQLRVAIGAPALPADPRVVLAAQRHADYSALNNVGGHYETAGLPGFSGVAPRDRLIAAGWTTSFVSEVATGSGSARSAVDQLWDAPYHRLGMMHPNATAAGWGHSDLSGHSRTVGNFVYDFGVRPVEFVRSPAHGQVGVPPQWSAREAPSPLPAGVSGPVGYPIMVVYSAGQRADMRAAEIVAPDGSRVPFYYVPQQFEFDYQVIIPQRLLTAGTTFHVRMDLTVNGRMVTNEWDFTTAGAGGAVAIPTTPPSYHSKFVDQTAWPTLLPGQSTQVTLRFRNTGTATWRRGVMGQQANLGLSGDTTRFADFGMSVSWPAASRVAIQTEAEVTPGAIGTFAFSLRAPAALGTYRLPLRPVVDGTAWMEDEGVFVVVKSDHGWHSAWQSQSAYPTLRPGELSAPLSIVFRNTGLRPWVQGVMGHQANLGINGDDRSWASLGVGWPTPDRVAIQTEASVVPGADATFTFRVRAPLQPGTYAIHLRPVIDAAAWLEDQGVFLYITVR